MAKTLRSAKHYGICTYTYPTEPRIFMYAYTIRTATSVKSSLAALACRHYNIHIYLRKYAMQLVVDSHAQPHVFFHGGGEDVCWFVHSTQHIVCIRHRTHLYNCQATLNEASYVYTYTIYIHIYIRGMLLFQVNIPSTQPLLNIILFGNNLQIFRCK